jgi:hypothetical protein
MASSDFNNFRKRMELEGGNIRESKKMNTANNVANVFANNPNYIEAEVIKPNGQTFTFGARYINENELNARTFLFATGSDIKEGDIIVMNEDSSKWMTFIDYYNGIFPKAKTRKINSLVKIDFGNEVLEFMAHGVHRTANIREDALDVNSPSTKADFYLQENESSMRVKVNMRFLIKGQAYVVESIDNVSLDNILRIVAKTDSIMPNDDIVNDIADNNVSNTGSHNGDDGTDWEAY